MNQAAILLTGSVADTTGFKNIRFTLQGALWNFNVGSTKFIYLESNALATEDNNGQHSIPNGYYPEDAFFDYRIGKLYIYQLNEKKYTFKHASAGDIVKVKRLKLTTSALEFATYESFEFPYQGYSWDPTFPVKNNYTTEKWNEEPESLSFFQNNILLLNTLFPNVNDPEREKRQILIHFTAIYIHNIIYSIFPLFSNSGATITNLINNQKSLWNVLTTEDMSNEELSLYYQGLKHFYDEAYEQQKKIKSVHGVEKIFWLCAVLHPTSFAILDIEIRLKLLLLIIDTDEAELGDTFSFQINYESVVVYIFQSVQPDECDIFLKGLLREEYHTKYGGNLLGFLMRNMGSDNEYANEFVWSLYLIWAASKYNPYQNGEFNENNFNRFRYNRKQGTNLLDGHFLELLFPVDWIDYSACPFSLNYTSTKSAGIYFDNFYFYSNLGFTAYDNGDFKDDFLYFDENHESGELQQNNSDLADDDAYIHIVEKEYRDSDSIGLYGTYHVFQPISLISTDQEAALLIPTIDGNKIETIQGHPEKISGLVPAFLIAYIDKVGSERNFWTMVGYAIDVASIFGGGIGAISKLRHIRKLSGFTESLIAGNEFGSDVLVSLYFAFASETVSFTSGALSFLFKLTEEIFENEPWYQDLRNTLNWIEVFAGCGTVLSERMLRVSVNKLVGKYDTGGWPAQFLNDSRGLVASQTLIKVSDNVIESLAALKNQYISKIRKNVIKRVNDDSEFQFNLVGTNTPLHSEAQIDQILTNGYNQKVPLFEMEGLLAVSYRAKKQISTSSLISQTDNWITVIKPRGYSYKFSSLAEYETFQDEMISLLDDFDIPSKDVRLQGSSLRNPNGKDTDVAIFLDNQQFNLIKTKIKKQLKERFLDANGKMRDLAEVKYLKALKRLENEFEKGYIRSINFGKNANGKSFMQEFYDRGVYPKSKGEIDISVIIKDKNFDTPPYLYFKP